MKIWKYEICVTSKMLYAVRYTCCVADIITTSTQHRAQHLQSTVNVQFYSLQEQRTICVFAFCVFLLESTEEFKCASNNLLFSLFCTHPSFCIYHKDCNDTKIYFHKNIHYKYNSFLRDQFQFILFLSPLPLR